MHWVFASSNVQRTEKLPNFVQSIEWIVILSKSQILNESQLLKIFQKIYDQWFCKKHNDVATCKVLIEAHLSLVWNNWKLVLLQIGEILINFWRRYHRGHFISVKKQPVFNLCSPSSPLDIWFSVFSGYRIATLLEIGLESFVLESFVKVSWIA